MFRPAVLPPQGAKLLADARQLPTRRGPQSWTHDTRADWMVTLQQLRDAVTAARWTRCPRSMPTATVRRCTAPGRPRRG